MSVGATLVRVFLRVDDPSGCSHPRQAARPLGRRRCRCGWLAIVASLATASIAAADEAADLSRKLLQDGWAKGITAREQSAEWFATAADAIKNDPRVRWAYIVNRMRHLRVEEARTALADYLRDHPEHLDGLYSEAWIETFVGDPDAALSAIGRWHQAAQKSGLPAEAAAEGYQRIGRLIGFSESVRAARISPITLNETLAAMEKEIPRDTWQRLIEQRQAVRDRFDQLAQERQAIGQDELQRLEAQRQDDRVREEASLQQLSEQAQRQRADRDAAASSGQQELASMESSLVSSQAEVDRASAEAAAVQWDLTQLWGTLAHLDARLAVERNPTARAILFRDRNHYTWLARDREAYFAIAAGQASAAAAQHRSLAAGYDLKRQALQSRLGEFDRQLESIEQAARRSRRRIAELQKEPRVKTGRMQALADQMKALTSHEAFPDESFRQRALQMLTDHGE